MSKFIKYGIYLGILLSVIDAIKYVIDPISVLGSFTSIAITSLISLVAVYFAMRIYKDEHNGTASYMETLRVISVVLVVAMTITVFYEIVLFNLVTPDYFQTHKTEILELGKDQITKMGNAFGMNETAMAEQMQKIDSEAEQHITEMEKDAKSSLGISKNYAINLIACLVVALLVSVFFKKRANNSEQAA